MKKRDREVHTEECPKCGAKAGQLCKNYLGKNKQACRLVIEIVTPRKAASVVSQPSLFQELTKGE